jgi:single-stranded-DNA-specific exonuclease
VLSNPTPLDKAALFELLSLRFCKEETKLSQIPNPALLLNAEKAALKIANTIRANKKITLVGDYDVDGVSSSAIMVDFFAQIPYPLNAVIPNRFTDGYGVSANVLTRIEADLIITVDNGITACEAADICKQRGIDLIITDHHTPPDILPDAFTIVDPKLSDCIYPFKEICGAQVAWLLLALLKKELQLSINMRGFLDILAIAIIADVMPLVDMNRTLVKEGLKELMRSSRPSSVIIRDFLNKSAINAEDIAFMIAPRLNSAGRLENASIALEFFTAPTIEKAYKQFELLGQLNDLRKATEAECTKEAMENVDENDLVLVVAGEQWNEGVVGIVASRLVDKFSKPAIVLSVHEGIAKGSARSIADVSIYALIKENEHLLTKFGGHKMAAGLGLLEENIAAFKKAINATAKNLDPKDFIPKNELIGTIATDEINLELLDLLEQFEPYGEANLRPRFLIKNAEVVSIKLLGADKSHSKIEIRQASHERKTLELLAFRTVFEMPENKKITCSYTIAKNEFNNRISLQLLLHKIY